MKVYAYKVSPTEEWTNPLELAFRIAQQTPLERRLRKLSSSMVRLEDIRFAGDQVFSNFVLFRSGSGPALVSSSSHMSEINIQEDQYFGEDTACLFDPASGYILIQYNHHGPKASAIQEYLSYFENERFHSHVFAPKLSPSSEQKIRGLSLVSRVEVSFAVTSLVNHGNAGGLSFGEAVDVAGAHGAETLSLVIGNRRGLALSAIKDLLVGLQSAASCGEGVKKLTLTAQVEDGSPREPIDLIAERLSGQVNVPLGPGRRYSANDRWSRMAALLQSWTAEGFLT
jgi:hypothetical protein